MTITTNTTVKVTHRFNASAETVFDAWLDPKLLAAWMFSPAIKGEEVVGIRIDGRQGGGFHYTIRRLGQVHEYRGTYLELKRPERLVFTWVSATEPQKTLVSVTIAVTASGCEVCVLHELGDVARDIADLVEARWHAEMDQLSRTLH